MRSSPSRPTRPISAIVARNSLNNKTPGIASARDTLPISEDLKDVVGRSSSTPRSKSLYPTLQLRERQEGHKKLMADSYVRQRPRKDMVLWERLAIPTSNTSSTLIRQFDRSRKTTMVRTLLRDNAEPENIHDPISASGSQVNDTPVRGVKAHRKMLLLLEECDTSLSCKSSLLVQQQFYVRAKITERLLGMGSKVKRPDVGIASEYYGIFDIINNPLCLIGARLSQSQLLMGVSQRSVDKEIFLEYVVHGWTRLPSLGLGAQLGEFQYMTFMLRAYQAVLGSVMTLIEPQALNIAFVSRFRETIPQLQEEVIASVRRDWIRDTKGQDSLTHNFFILAVLDFVRTWLPVFSSGSMGIIAQTKFIERLFSRITCTSYEGAIIWRSFSSITHVALPDRVHPVPEGPIDRTFIGKCIMASPEGLVLGPVRLYRRASRINARNAGEMSYQDIFDNIQPIGIESCNEGHFEDLERRIGVLNELYSYPLLQTKPLKEEEEYFETTSYLESLTPRLYDFIWRTTPPTSQGPMFEFNQSFLKNSMNQSQSFSRSSVATTRGVFNLSSLSTGRGSKSTTRSRTQSKGRGRGKTRGKETTKDKDKINKRPEWITYFINKPESEEQSASIFVDERFRMPQPIGHGGRRLIQTFKHIIDSDLTSNT